MQGFYGNGRALGFANRVEFYLRFDDESSNGGKADVIGLFSEVYLRRALLITLKGTIGQADPEYLQKKWRSNVLPS